jgi:hypothetical protein
MPILVKRQMKIDAARKNTTLASIAAEAYLHYSLLLRRVARDEAKTPLDAAISELLLQEARDALAELLEDREIRVRRLLAKLEEFDPNDLKDDAHPKKWRRFSGMNWRKITARKKREKRAAADNEQGTAE